MACGILAPQPGSNPHTLHLKAKSFFFFQINLFIYLFLAVLGLRFCARAFSSCGERGPLFIAVRGPLTIVASLVAEHRLQTRRLSSCGSRAQSLRGMWDPPGPGLEPVSPALAGGFSTTVPPGKPGRRSLNHWTAREVPEVKLFQHSFLQVYDREEAHGQIFQTSTNQLSVSLEPKSKL